MPPLKLAIIGGGPSSFYVASRLLSIFPQSDALSSQLKIHVYDRLWAPHGLVRYGVAPDHPEVKNCTHKFDQAANDPRLRFFGNVQVGPQTPPAIPHTLPISLISLKSHYTHLLFSTGCAIPTLHPSLPSSDYVIPALSLVHWYTQHASRPTPPPLHETEHVSIVGQGNVALDVARMLLTPPAALAKCDVPAPVLGVLRRSAVRHVSIIGRRGPLQAAFTTKELRELTTLDGTSMLPLAPEILAPPTPDAKLTRQQTRLLQLLQQQQRGASRAPDPGPSHTKSWSLDFFRSPTALVTAPDRHRHRLSLTLAHTTLDASARAVPTGVTSVQHTDLVVAALGHHADPAAAYVDPALGHLRTGRGGRVLDDTGHALRHVYASGWAATGARGVLASTMLDAYAVADAILRDYHFGDAREAPVPEYSEDTLVADDAVDLESVPEEVEEGVRTRRVVQYDQWKKIDAEEVRRGAEMDKERERMSWDEAHEFLTSTGAWHSQ
ncbi:FAD/NAD-P-binding domain-containing protein [Lactarius psammicola]|nr:FAD/NAD-P-binding domain-containing protein [Lactarius psammicola]